MEKMSGGGSSWTQVQGSEQVDGRAAHIPPLTELPARLSEPDVAVTLLLVLASSVVPDLLASICM
jgi:hypothetical protein